MLSLTCALAELRYATIDCLYFRSGITSSFHQRRSESGLQCELLAVAFGRLWQPHQQLQSQAQIANRLQMSCALACPSTGHTQILNGLLDIGAALIVMGQLVHVIVVHSPDVIGARFRHLI